VGKLLPFLSFRLVRNLSDDVFIQVIHQGIYLPDDIYLHLSAHILYLFFPDYGASAILTKFIINKFMQEIPAGKTMRKKSEGFRTSRNDIHTKARRS